MSVEIEGRSKLFGAWGPWTPMNTYQPAEAADEVRHLLTFAGGFDRVTITDTDVKLQYRIVKSKKKKK